MPFQIRHKATGEIIAMNSRKKVWDTIGAAKASFLTSGVPFEIRGKYGYKPDGDQKDENGRRLGRRAWRFDNQDIFEIVELKYATTAQRFCFKSFDGDNFLIPAELSEVFNSMEENEDYDVFSDTFDLYRCDSHQNWTFTDPKEDA